ncbi:zf-HC2 domain-containing protein [Desulfosporosinus sp. FKA]|uniref:anti-sigma factor family protein n=1 Tax=Desulfosporosinus sp. FKA TaxID=1969834 RepID=UPI000B498312|nr:zf-HC2 domain-containing protein [Desulfosporosinus sp. FKA]
MECLQCIEHLPELLDGELDANKYRKIEDHLHRCPDCRQVRDELAALSKEINQSIASIPVPTNLSMRILSAIEKEQYNTAKDIWLTSILLAILHVFSRTFSSVFHLVYATGSAFWRSLMTIVTLVSPWAAVTVGVLSLVLMITGLYIVKTLLTKFEVNEVIP